MFIQVNIQVTVNCTSLKNYKKASFVYIQTIKIRYHKCKFLALNIDFFRKIQYMKIFNPKKALDAVEIVLTCFKSSGLQTSPFFWRPLILHKITLNLYYSESL